MRFASDRRTKTGTLRPSTNTRYELPPTTLGSHWTTRPRPPPRLRGSSTRVVSSVCAIKMEAAASDARQTRARRELCAMSEVAGWRRHANTTPTAQGHE